MTIRTRMLALCAALALTTPLPPTPAIADEAPVAQQPVVVVADFSGSMNRTDADSAGTSRIAAAKGAVKGLLRRAPAGSRLGLVVYGARDDSCSDVQTLNRVGSFDAVQLGAKVNALAAKGNTPIGPALRHAADELRDVAGPRSIVLVSDGEPNCTPPDPCEVAREISRDGISLRVHTIGFRVTNNPAARRALQCIAAVTGGRHTDVEDAEGLDRALRVETTRALAGYVARGVRIPGGTGVSVPQELMAGQYVVPLASGPVGDAWGEDDGEPNRRYFAVPYHRGWDTVVSATLVPPRGAAPTGTGVDRELDLVETGPTTSLCSGASGRDSQTGVLDTVDLTVSMRMRSGQGQDCLDRAGRRVIAVRRTGQAWANQPLDVELTVGYVRSDVKAGQAADPGSASATTPSESSAVPMRGGASFNDATVLRPGQTISDDVRGRERRYFAVPVRYGQTMDLRFVLTGGQERTASSSVSVVPFNPLRQPMAMAGGTSSDGRLTVLTAGGTHSLHGVLAHPILPEHVGSADPDVQAAGVAGMQYLVVGRSEGEDERATALRFTLTPAVRGTPSSVMAQVVTTPEQYALQFPALSGPRPSASGASTPSTAPASTSGRTVVPSPRRVPAVPGSWLLGGSAGAAVVGVVVWSVVRRSRRW